jgi:primosomal replication protein N''
MSSAAQLFGHFLDKLSASVTKSPLLRVNLTRTGRLLDCARLRVVDEDLPERLMEAVVSSKPAVAVNLRLRASRPNRAPVKSGAPDQPDLFEVDEMSETEKRLNEHQSLYHLLDRRIQREAELALRETGVHALWLGYPLRYVPAAATVGPWILAPVFLWPISVTRDQRAEGRFQIRHNQDVGGATFNQAMATWVRRQLQIELKAPSLNDLDDLDPAALRQLVAGLANQFSPPLDLDHGGRLRSPPPSKNMTPASGPQLYHSAVLGYFRWPNEAIQSDLDELRERKDHRGVFAGFFSGQESPRPVEVSPPSEADRYAVSDLDFSQERAVWQARHAPGVVVHGPPGTGKSQTIVNIIADALAHDRTVLMVCQKQAATRVVLERLRGVGLAELCVEVHDPDADRMTVFKSVREQVEKLQDADFTSKLAERAALARQIDEVESKLDRHAKAVHERHPGIGLSFRQMKAREGRILRDFSTVRAWPSLRSQTENMAVEAVDAACDRLAAIGNLFRAADPFRNPWTRRRPDVTRNPAVAADVDKLLQRLTELDKRHGEVMRQHGGAGFSVPGNIAQFLEIAAEATRRLRPLAEAAASSAARVTRQWIKTLRGADDSALSRHRARCDEAVRLARDVEQAPLDAAWHAICARCSDLELAALRAHVGQLQRCRVCWYGFLIPGLSFLIPGCGAAESSVRQLQPAAVGAAFWPAVEGLERYLHARSLRQQLRQGNEQLTPGIVYQNEDEKNQLRYTELSRAAFEQAAWLCRQERDHPWLAALVGASISPQDQPKLVAHLKDLDRAVQRAPIARELAAALTALDGYFLPGALDEPHGRVARGDSLGAWLSRTRRGFEHLLDLAAWEAQRRALPAEDRPLLASLEEYETQRLHGASVPAPPIDLGGRKYGEWWAALVRFNAAQVWQLRCRHDYPILAQITPESHEEDVQKLRGLLVQKRKLEADAIRARWLDQQLRFKHQDWKRWFQMRRGNERAKRLREAVDLSLHNGLLAMRPCWLVSPSTACQLFPLKPGLFDLVIFDEASQCPLEQAAPVIYRGRTLVVSGDAKQLPPTGFFSSRLDEGEDEDGEESEAEPPESLTEQQRLSRRAGVEFLKQADDLLEAAVGYLPDRHLRVHYRSEDSALIQFSNHAFYGGQLEMPPARRPAPATRRPIVYHEVGGVYENRRNEAEARAVVALLKECWLGEKQPPPTVGVVTFNKPQRDRIEDLIEEECEANEEFAVRFLEEKARKDGEQDVGFFVKNLENVQGDERDVMIFSTTFGRTADNRFRRNFGPVSAAGGERRLNVAVTRAKKQVHVVSSLPIEAISPALSATDAPGALTPAGYLQLYLAYAKAVSAADSDRARGLLHHLAKQTAGASVEVTEGPESPFEEEVLQTLHQLGYQVDCQVGQAGFRIDLAVRHPDPERGYVLGVECDGATYHSSRSARARDVWRQDILTRQGWTIHRIWSTRWWDYREQEVQRLQISLLQVTQ